MGIRIEIEYKDFAIYPVFAGVPERRNDSIGWYEWWGHREYDDQPDYITCDDSISWNEKYFTDEENAAIEAYLNANIDYVNKELCSYYEENPEAAY